ncbi:hypothetical protein FLSA109164_12635 [Flavobacterium saliperosum]
MFFLVFFGVKINLGLNVRKAFFDCFLGIKKAPNFGAF